MWCCWRRKKPLSACGPVVMSNSNLLPATAQVKVIQIVSASSIIVTFPLQGRIYGFTINLFGVIFPSIKTCMLEDKQRAIRAKTYLSTLILNMDVTIHWISTNEYVVQYNGHDINQIMKTTRF